MLAALLLLAAPSLLAQGDDDGVTIELFTPGADETAAAAETTVGMGVDLVEFVIPGAEVRARPASRGAGRARAGSQDPGRAPAPPRRARRSR